MASTDKKSEVPTAPTTATVASTDKKSEVPTAPTTATVVASAPVKAEIPKAEGGGIFDGPKSGYPVLLHAREMVIPLPNTKALEVQKTELSEITNNSNVTNNVQNIAQANQNLEPFMEIFDMMAAKLDDMIDKLSTGNDIQDELLKVSRV